jgi:hypothetical protein
MKLRHAAALALATCVLTSPAMSPGGPAETEFGIPTKAECEAQLKRMGSMVGYYGEKPHCDCSNDSPSPKETPKPQHD